MYEVPESTDVVLVGCPSGVDFEVLHEPDAAHVLVRGHDGREWRVPASEWKEAVFGFADQVSEFYATSSAKKPSAEDEAGFRSFVAEWQRRRGRPLVANCRPMEPLDATPPISPSDTHPRLYQGGTLRLTDTSPTMRSSHRLRLRK
jgi:hypothetical protein